MSVVEIFQFFTWSVCSKWQAFSISNLCFDFSCFIGKFGFLGNVGQHLNQLLFYREKPLGKFLGILKEFSLNSFLVGGLSLIKFESFNKLFEIR